MYKNKNLKRQKKRKKKKIHTGDPNTLRQLKEQKHH